MRIILGVLLIIFAVFFFVMLCTFRKRIKVAGILLTYSAKFLAAKPINFIFIPIFLALTVGLIVLSMFEYLAFSSNSNPEAHDQDIFLQLKGNSLLTALVIIQFIWGMQFLKDTCTSFLTQSTSSSQETLSNGTADQTLPPTAAFQFQDSSSTTLDQWWVVLSSMLSLTSWTFCSRP